jgi:hypothetical protein
MVDAGPVQFLRRLLDQLAAMGEEQDSLVAVDGGPDERRCDDCLPGTGRGDKQDPPPVIRYLGPDTGNYPRLIGAESCRAA